MVEANLAQNAFIQIDLAKFKNGAVALATAAATVAGAVFVLEVQGIQLEWIALKLFDTINKVDVANLTGPSKTATCEVPSYDSVRVRRTDATGGNGTVGINFREG